MAGIFTGTFSDFDGRQIRRQPTSQSPKVPDSSPQWRADQSESKRTG
jgi:hypothetical protein